MNLFLFIYLQVTHSCKSVQNVWLFCFRRKIVLVDFYQALAICQYSFQVSDQITRSLFGEFLRFPEHESRIGDSFVLMFPNLIDLKVNSGIELDENRYNLMTAITFPVKR